MLTLSHAWQSAGWASVFGFSAVFAGLALLLVWIDIKFK